MNILKDTQEAPNILKIWTLSIGEVFIFGLRMHLLGFSNTNNQIMVLAVCLFLSNIYIFDAIINRNHFQLHHSGYIAVFIIFQAFFVLGEYTFTGLLFFCAFFLTHVTKFWHIYIFCKQSSESYKNYYCAMYHVPSQLKSK